MVGSQWLEATPVGVTSGRVPSPGEVVACETRLAHLLSLILRVTEQLLSVKRGAYRQ